MVLSFSLSPRCLISQLEIMPLKQVDRMIIRRMAGSFSQSYQTGFVWFFFYSPNSTEQDHLNFVQYLALTLSQTLAEANEQRDKNDNIIDFTNDGICPGGFHFARPRKSGMSEQRYPLPPSQRANLRHRCDPGVHRPFRYYRSGALFCADGCTRVQRILALGRRRIFALS